MFCHFEFEANLGMILAVVDLGRSFESIFEAHLGWGRFGGVLGENLGMFLGRWIWVEFKGDELQEDTHRGCYIQNVWNMNTWNQLA